MARVLALANPGSASGKTAAAFGIATMLVDLEQRVLVVDLDAQAALTRALGIDAEKLDCSIFEVLVQSLPVTDAMLDTDHMLDVLPASLELSGVEALLMTRSGREQLLRTALEPVRDDYDWIVIDCASSMGLLTQNALAMADVLLMPMRGQSMRAETQLLAAVDDMRRFVNQSLLFEGVLSIGNKAYEGELSTVAQVPAPPLALNAYRELAKKLMRSAAR